MQNVWATFLLAAIVIDVAAQAPGDDLADNAKPRMTSYFELFIAAARQGATDGIVLGGDYLVDPPNESFGYWATPKNSLTFAKMGVDGVHTAIITFDGMVREDSPVVYISPMDFDSAVTVVAPTFLDYLADGCGIDRSAMAEALESSQRDPGEFLRLLDSNFDSQRLLESDRIERLNGEYLDQVQVNPL